MVTQPVDVIVLHEQDDRDAEVRERLAVSVEKSAARIVVGADLSGEGEMLGQRGNRSAVLASLAATGAAARWLAVPRDGRGVPGLIGEVGLVSEPERFRPCPRGDLEDVAIVVDVMGDHV